MERGYWLAKQFFNKEEICSIRFKMEKIFKNYIGSSTDESIIKLFKEDFQGFIGCANQCQKLLSVYNLAGSLEDVLKIKCDIKLPTMNTKPLVSFSSKHTSKSEVYWKIPAHQDSPSNLGSKNGVTCWIPLQDTNEDLGPLEVSPNSHLLGELPHKNLNGVPVLLKNNFKFDPMPMDVGDALFFNTMLVHKSGLNKTENSIRWSMHFRYNDAMEQSFVDRKYTLNRTGD